MTDPADVVVGNPLPTSASRILVLHFGMANRLTLRLYKLPSTGDGNLR